MLTPYRTQGAPEMSGSTDSALNWYSRRLARELLQANTRVTIVGPRSRSASATVWEDEGTEVHSVFVRGSTWSVWQAYARIASLRNVIVHVQHELFAFGGLASALMLPTMMASLRRRGLKVVTTIHGVIPLSEVSDDFVKANRIPGNATTARALWRVLLRRVALASDVVHVHEHFLQTLLEGEYGLSSVLFRVIPLGVDPQQRKVDQVAARNALGIPQHAEVALFFGYLSAYKGIEYLLAELPAMLAELRDLHVVIAGAVPSRLTGSLDPSAIVEKLPVGRDRVHVCGFVPDSDTPVVFGAADVLLLPYRVAMSSSGPLALAIGFDVPALLSESFESSFPMAPCLFELKPGSLTSALRRFFNEPQVRTRAREFVAHIRASRSWTMVAHSLSALYKELVSQR